VFGEGRHPRIRRLVDRSDVAALLAERLREGDHPKLAKLRQVAPDRSLYLQFYPLLEAEDMDLYLM
jgi:hypothetical protein